MDSSGDVLNPVACARRALPPWGQVASAVGKDAVWAVA